MVKERLKRQTHEERKLDAGIFLPSVLPLEYFLVSLIAGIGWKIQTCTETFCIMNLELKNRLFLSFANISSVYTLSDIVLNDALTITY